MKYNFETTIDRTNLASSKWAGMRRVKPDVSKGIVPFSVADMEFVNAPEIIDGLKKHLDETILGYAEPYNENYLRIVCGWMKRHHAWDVEPEWIRGAPGVVDAFYWAIQAFTKPGDGVIVQTPVYYPFYDAIRRNERAIVANPLVRFGNRYLVDFDDLERKAKDPNTTALLFCSPHNPTGRVWSEEELARVGKICLDNNVFIISDEIHFDLIMPHHHHTVFATLSRELADNMIVCTAPSKTFNLAGMKTSNVIIPNAEVRERYTRQVQKNGFYSLCQLGYKACEIAYTQCEDWLQEALSVIYRNHLELKDFMVERIPEIQVFDLEGTYLQWMDFSGLGLSGDELESTLRDKAEIFFDEGGIFGEEGRGFERMNIACPTAIMMEALKRLETAIRSVRPA